MPENPEKEDDVIRVDRKEDDTEKHCPICDDEIYPNDPRYTSKEWIETTGGKKLVDIHTHCMYEEPDKLQELRTAK